ncbi:hypothetical protein ACOSP7_009676 [Xanthoceras sorbifolium]
MEVSNRPHLPHSPLSALGPHSRKGNSSRPLGWSVYRTWSSNNIPFKNVLDRLNLKGPVHNSYTIPLNEFTGDSVVPIRSILLSVVLSKAPVQINTMVEFVAIDPQHYNIIPGKLILDNIRGYSRSTTTSSNFQLGIGIGVVRGDQQAPMKRYTMLSALSALAK